MYALLYIPTSKYIPSNPYTAVEGISQNIRHFYSKKEAIKYVRKLSKAILHGQYIWEHEFNTGHLFFNPWMPVSSYRKRIHTFPVRRSVIARVKSRYWESLRYDYMQDSHGFHCTKTLKALYTVDAMWLIRYLRNEDPDYATSELAFSKSEFEVIKL